MHGSLPPARPAAATSDGTASQRSWKPEDRGQARPKGQSRAALEETVFSSVGGGVVTRGRRALLGCWPCARSLPRKNSDLLASDLGVGLEVCCLSAEVFKKEENGPRCFRDGARGEVIPGRPQTGDGGATTRHPGSCRLWGCCLQAGRPGGRDPRPPAPIRAERRVWPCALWAVAGGHAGQSQTRRGPAGVSGLAPAPRGGQSIVRAAVGRLGEGFPQSSARPRPQWEVQASPSVLPGNPP